MFCEVSYLYIGLLTQLSYLTYVGYLNRLAYLLVCKIATKIRILKELIRQGYPMWMEFFVHYQSMLSNTILDKEIKRG